MGARSTKWLDCSHEIDKVVANRPHNARFVDLVGGGSPVCRSRLDCHPASSISTAGGGLGSHEQPRRVGVWLSGAPKARIERGMGIRPTGTAPLTTNEVRSEHPALH